MARKAAKTQDKGPRYVELPITEFTDDTLGLIYQVTNEVSRQTDYFGLIAHEDGTLTIYGPVEYVLWAFYLFITLRIRAADAKYHDPVARENALDDIQLWTGFEGIKLFLNKQLAAAEKRK